MLYNKIECPNCGNEITASSSKEPQKCKWCRRLFKVILKRRNKDGKKAKFEWKAEPVDFEENNSKYQNNRIRSLSDYENKDIYGR